MLDKQQQQFWGSTHPQKSLSYRHYFWTKKNCWPNRTHTQTHTHTCSNPMLADRCQVRLHDAASRQHACMVRQYTQHIVPVTQLRRFFMKLVRSYSSSYCFSSHKSGSVSNTVFIVRAPDATGWFLEDFWLSFFLSSSENKSKSWKQTQTSIQKEGEEIVDTYLLTYSMEQSPSWEAKWFCSQSRNSPRFMEPESPLPYSQAPANCLYP